MFWGALDVTIEEGRTPGYTGTQIVTGGPSAAVGSGIGVRRASLVIDRKDQDAGADDAYMHFDFLNTTSGSPDDTWTSTDFSTLEGYLNTFWGSVVNRVPPGQKLREIRWHRVGTGVGHPNPAERILVESSPVTGTATGAAAPQNACSITFRTGVRRSWGRTYLPVGDIYLSTGRFSTTVVDAVATAAHTLVTSAAGSDFLLVVVSGPLSSSLVVESIEVDNVGDIIRRRRWKKQTYRKILP